MRLRSSLAVGMMWVLGGALVPTASGAPVGRTCDELSGKPVLRTKAIRIVARPYHRISGEFEDVGRRFYGCALPSGKVHDLGFAGRTYIYDAKTRPHRKGEHSRSVRTFSSPAGRYVLTRLQTTCCVLVEELERKLANHRVVDLGSGRGYTYFARNLPVDQGSIEEGLRDERVVAVRLSASGVLAGLYGRATETRQPGRMVKAFTPAGARKVLDRGPTADLPVAALQLTGNVVSWSHAGTARSAAITAATPAYAPGTRPQRCDEPLTGELLPSTGKFQLLRRTRTTAGITYVDYFVCARPAGRLIFLESAGSFGPDDGREISFPAMAGEHFVMRVVRLVPPGTDAFGKPTEAQRIVTDGQHDVRPRKGSSASYGAEIYGSSENKPPGGFSGPPQVPVLDLIDADGRSVVLYDTADGTQRVLTTGNRKLGGKVLDTAAPSEIPAESVRLANGVVTWTHSGAARSHEAEVPFS